MSVAVPSPPEMRRLLERLRRSAPGDGAGKARRARLLAAAAGRFTDPGDPLRRRAVDALPALTGFSAEMIETVLPRIFAPIVEAALVEIVSTAATPVARLVGIVSAGNLPGVALAKAALALTAGAACIVKTAAGEPLLTVLFAEAVAAEDPELAASLAVLWWPGGAAPCEREFLGGLDSLIAYGSDEAIRGLAEAAPATFVGHGHKVSVAVVRLDDSPDSIDLARAAALDVALYDQLGCLSPQCVFSLGGDRAAHGRFVEALAAALDDLDRQLPPAPLSDAEALSVRRFRDEYEWREFDGQEVSVRGVSGRWTVIDDRTAGFGPCPLHRTIVVRRLDSWEELPRALGRWLPYVESIGIGPWPPGAGRGVIDAIGVPRVAPLGRMQDPDLGWRQGGLDPMAGILVDHVA